MGCNTVSFIIFFSFLIGAQMKTNSNYIGLMNNGIHDSNGFSAIYPCPNGLLFVCVCLFFLFYPKSAHLFDWFGIILLLVFFGLTRYLFLSIAINSIDVENRAWFNFQNGIWWYIWFGTSISYECSRYTEAIMDLLFCTMRYDCEQQPWALTDVRKTDNFQFENTTATNIYAP